MRNFLLIEWADASHPTDSGWLDPDDYHLDELTMYTAGWVVRETKTTITLAGSVTTHASGKVQGMQTIPRTQIRKLKRWKDGKR